MLDDSLPERTLIANKLVEIKVKYNELHHDRDAGRGYDIMTLTILPKKPSAEAAERYGNEILLQYKEITNALPRTENKNYMPELNTTDGKTTLTIVEYPSKDGFNAAAKRLEEAAIAVVGKTRESEKPDTGTQKSNYLGTGNFGGSLG